MPTVNRRLSDLVSGSASLDAGDIDTGTFADARISAGNVSQHVVAFDDSSIRSDLTIVALRQAIGDNQTRYNLPNSFIDQFEDTNGIGTLTTTERTTAGDIGVDRADAAGILRDIVTGDFIFGSLGSFTVGSAGSFNHSNSPDEDAGIIFDDPVMPVNSTFELKFTAADGGTNYGLVFSFINTSDRPAGTPTNSGQAWKPTASGGILGPVGAIGFKFGTTGGGSAYWGDGSSTLVSSSHGLTGNGLRSIKRTAAGNFQVYNAAGANVWDTQNYSYIANQGQMSMIIGGQGGHAGGATGVQVAIQALDVTSATGTIISTASVPPSATTKVSGVLLYKDRNGTATLGTDLRIYFTCNGGTNWTEVLAADFTAVTPVFSSAPDIKMVKLAEKTCTSGSDIRYKVVWANQLAGGGGKDTLISGIGLNY